MWLVGCSSNLETVKFAFQSLKSIEFPSIWVKNVTCSWQFLHGFSLRHEGIFGIQGTSKLVRNLVSLPEGRTKTWSQATSPLQLVIKVGNPRLFGWFLSQVGALLCKTVVLR